MSLVEKLDKRENCIFIHCNNISSISFPLTSFTLPHFNSQYLQYEKYPESI